MKTIDGKTVEKERRRNRESVIAAVGMLVFSGLLIAMKFYLSALSVDFVIGAAAGFFFCFGLLGLTVRAVRELD